MMLPFISRKKHKRLMSEYGEKCRETIVSRNLMWDKTLRMAEDEIKELKSALKEKK
jgi:hypothetical protein